MKMLITPIFLRIGMFSFQIIGTGINMIIKSVKTSVAVKTVSMSRVLVHWVKKRVMGAQFQVHSRPHWKRVAKKNASDQAIVIAIIDQQMILNSLTCPNILFQRNNMDSLIKPSVIFSTV